MTTAEPLDPMSTPAPRSEELAQQAEALLDRGHLDLADGHVQWALTLEPADPDTLTSLALTRALLAQERRDFETAASACLQARLHSQATGDLLLQTRARMAEVVLDLEVGAHDAAWKALEESFEWTAQHTAPQTLAHALEAELWRTRSYAHMRLAQQQQALDAGQRSLEAAQAGNDEKALAHSQCNVAGRWYAMGYRLKSLGHATEARQALERAVELSLHAQRAAVAAGCLRLELSLLNNLAGALAALERDDEALARFAEIYAFGDRTGMLTIGVFARINHARVLFRCGNNAAAFALLEEGIRLGERLCVPQAVNVLYLQRSRQFEALGQWREALLAHKAFHEASKLATDEQAVARAAVLTVRLQTQEMRRETERLRGLTDQLSQQALRDTLTGLPNRRAMEQLLTALRDPGADDAGCAFVAMIDIDYFKQINDGYSHAIGDAVLRALGQVFARQLRSQDQVARWGGEEFVLLMRATTPEAALQVGERLRRAVEQYDWTSVAAGLQVTVSLGVAQADSTGSASDWLEVADAHLYAAKSGGRNRVHAAWLATAGRHAPA